MNEQRRQFPWLPESVEREGVLRIDWSSYKEIESCQRKAAMAVALRREPASDSIALNFGQAIHAALDVRQQGIMAGRRATEMMADMETALEREFGAFTVPPGDYRTLGRAKDVVGVYNQTFPDEPFEILASEQRAGKDLGRVRYGSGQTCDIIWQGVTDGIWRNRDTGEISIKDTKTSGRDEFAGDDDAGEFSKGEAKYQMSGQFMGYAWLFSTLGQPITGAVLDQVVIRKPVQKVTARTAPQNECKRRFFSYAPEQITEWCRDTLAHITDWLSACAQGQTPPPMTRTACAWPTVCGYFNSCVQRGEAARMERLAGPRFRDRTWNPMEARQ